MNAPRLFRYGLLVGIRDFTLFWNWKTWFGGWMVQTIAIAVFFSLFARLFDSPDHERFLLIGNAVAVGVMLVGWTSLSTILERGAGTYPLLVIAPASLVPAIMGRASIWMGAGVATTLGTFPVLGILFDLDLPWPDTLLVVPLVVLTCASTYCLTLFMGSLVARQPRSGLVVLGLWNTVNRAFCGVSVPIAFWPDPVEVIVRFLPITHGLQAIRLLLDKASAVAIFQEAALEAAVGLGWVVIAIFVMDRMANAGRKDGSIEFID